MTPSHTPVLRCKAEKKTSPPGHPQPGGPAEDTGGGFGSAKSVFRVRAAQPWGVRRHPQPSQAEAPPLHPS